MSYTCSIYGRFFDDEDEEDFYRIIKVLDSVWLTEWFTRNKSSASKTRSGSHGR